MGLFKTYFSLTEPTSSLLPTSSIVLSPRNPTWNDFGRQVYATIKIKGADSSCIALDGYVVAIDEKADPVLRSSFDIWLTGLKAGTSGELFEAGPFMKQFLTLLADDAAYRELAEWSSTYEIRMAVLHAINDINLARVFNLVQRDLLDRVIADDTFTLGVMRSSSAYRAFAKGARYLAEKVPPRIEDSRLDISVDVLLKGFEAPHVANFKFEGQPRLVSDRVQVLIGKNGTGKSQLLNQLVGSLALQADQSESDAFIDKSNASFNQAAAEWKAIPNSVLVFSTDTEDVFPRKARLDAPLDYWYFSLASQGSDEPTLEMGSLPLGRALLDLIRDDSTLLEKRRFSIFREIVDPILPLSLIHLPLKSQKVMVSGAVQDENGRQWLSLNRIPTGEKALLHLAAAVDTQRDLALIDLRRGTFPPSSGQRVYLRFATLALSAISQGSLLVVDEPETHLHPNFVSEFMQLLHDMLTATSSIALLATHSPYVVREVPTSCVHVVTQKGKVPALGSVHLKTLGASVSSISDAVFGDATATRFHQIVAKKLADQGKLASNNEAEQVAWLVEQFGDELNSEMLSTIRFLMAREVDEEAHGEADA